MVNLKELLMSKYSPEAMDAAKEEERKNKLMAILGKSSAIIGSSIAGSTKPDLSGYTSLEEAASAPVQDLLGERKSALEQVGVQDKLNELARVAEMEDPNSAISQSVQGLRSRLGIKEPQKLSARQAMTTLPYEEKVWAKEEAGKNRQNLLQQKAIEKEAKQAEVMSERDIKHIKDAQNEFENNNEVKKAREGLSAAEDVLSLLSSNNPIADEVAKSRLARLSGEVGVLTDADIARFGGSKAFLERFNNAISQAATGRLSPENRKFTIDVTNNMVERRKNILNRYADTKSKQLAVRLGRPQSETYKYLMPDIEETAKTIPSETAPKQQISSLSPELYGSKKIIKKQYSPSQDKTKFVYSDGTEEIVNGRK